MPRGLHAQKPASGGLRSSRLFVIEPAAGRFRNRWTEWASSLSGHATGRSEYPGVPGSAPEAPAGFLLREARRVARSCRLGDGARRWCSSWRFEAHATISRAFKLSHVEDLTPRNILLRVRGIDAWTEEDLFRCFGQPHNTVIEKRSDVQTDHAPPYAVQPIDFSKLDASQIDGLALLSDFGESFWAHTKSTELGVPWPFAAPELLFDEAPRATAAVDIWALACSVYTICSGINLSSPMLEPREDLLRDMVALLGKLPDEWWQRWDVRSEYFEEDGLPGSGPYAPVELESLRDQLMSIGSYGDDGLELPRAKRWQLPTVEFETLEELLSQMLVYRPAGRLTAKGVLESSWLQLADVAQCSDGIKMDQIGA